MNTKQLMWAYIIKNGTVAKWEFYSGRFVDYNDEKDLKTLKALREISRDGVDWEKTKEPRDDYQSEFTDTFHESINVATMEGTIVTTKGKKFKFATLWENPRNVFEIVTEIGSLDFDNILKEKCLNKKNNVES